MPAGRAIPLALSVWVLAGAAGAHVPFLQAQLTRWLRASDCVGAGRVQMVEQADGTSRWVAAPVLSWCGEELPQAVELPAVHGAVQKGWSVLFFRLQDGRWQALAPQGVGLRLERPDFAPVHRALRRAAFVARGSGLSADQRRKPWWELLAAQSAQWRYHAALELWESLQHDRGLTEQERNSLATLRARHPQDPALDLLERTR